MILTCKIAVAISLSWIGGKWYLRGKFVSVESKNSTIPCITTVASPRVKQPGNRDIAWITPQVLKLPAMRPHRTLISNPIYINNR